MEFNFLPIVASWRYLAAGLVVTLLLSGVSLLIGLVVGTVVGLLRTYGGRWANIVLSVYVDSARAIPVLVILVWVYFAFPLLIGHSLTPFQAASVGLGLHLAAYVSEVMRAGLTSVRQGQMRAGLVLGFSRFQVIRNIILPQATIRMLPALGSLAVIAVKDSSIAAVIAVPELMRQSQIVAQDSFRPFEVYTAAMIVYFLICYPIARGVDGIYRRLAPLGSS
jgi:His/Glu/Gln/Arg/opine family amino acid ABC transporter permease subunit